MSEITNVSCPLNLLRPNAVRLLYRVVDLDWYQRGTSLLTRLFYRQCCFYLILYPPTGDRRR